MYLILFQPVSCVTFVVGMNWHINLIGISSSDWALYSLPRCFFVYNFHTSSHAKNRRSKRQGKTSLSQNFFWKKWNFLNCVYFFYKLKNWRLPLFFLHEILKEVLLKFLPKMMTGETLCKLAQIFPPKVLVYMYEKFFLTPFHHLIEN